VLSAVIHFFERFFYAVLAFTFKEHFYLDCVVRYLFPVVGSNETVFNMLHNLLYILFSIYFKPLAKF